MKTYGKALILGAGLSGLGAARLLAAEGTMVTVADARPEHELGRAMAVLSELGARAHFGLTGLPREQFDLCVVSPGFAVDSDWVRAATQQCAVVLSELELGWSRASGRCIAITGSNGKSTAVKWCAESFQHAGQTAVPAGNYGVSVCDAVLQFPQLDWLVLEVSSFQLETVDQFRADIAVLTNIHPNHLDRHKTMEVYTDLKARLFANTLATDACVVPSLWRDTMRDRSAGQGEWITFGTEPDAGYRHDDGRVWRADVACADLRGTIFGQPGMGETAAAVVGVMDRAGVDPSHAVAAAGAFAPLPHRVQQVATINGVRYVNDSKSTNLAAIAHAVRMADGPVRLIAGGLAKETDFKSLKEVLAERVISVYLIGNSAEEMFSSWSRDVSCVMCRTLDEAVRQSGNDAQTGEVVLFSPGCASFDQFRNYEERGEYFTGRVRDLAGKGTS